MGKPTGFLEYERKNAAVLEPLNRIQNFQEFKKILSEEEQEKQGARCMDCGVPFCQSGMKLSGMISGCPLHNLIPETNDLVYHGKWRQAYERLEKTHCFPEFTSRVCPALCEAACTCGLYDKPVATKDNERAIIEKAFEKGWVQPHVISTRTGKKVAVIGSGPSGLAAAQQLNRKGHLVTVFEKNDLPGGLLRYGIPNMKLEKHVIDRRIRLMEMEGVTFRTGIDVGKDVKAEALRKEYDRIVLCCGAGQPRDLPVTGRDAKNIFFAVDFLTEVTKCLSLPEKKRTYPNIKGKHVLVIGGGDTGNDCVGTVIRLGAKSVIQLEMMPEPSEHRSCDNPWPEWPKIKKTDYGQEEAIAVFGHDPRRYQKTVTEFIKDDKGNVQKAKIISLQPQKDEKSGKTTMGKVEGSEEIIPAEIVLIAAGFLGSQKYISDAFHITLDQRTNVKTACNKYETSVPGIFTAGDMHTGQSLVVRAIAEGRYAAEAVDMSLMGYEY